MAVTKFLVSSLILLVGHSFAATDTPVEWAGIFPTPEGTYKWLAQKVDGCFAVKTYPDQTMKLSVFSSASATKAELDTLKTTGGGLDSLDGACTPLQNGGVIVVPTESFTCYELQFDGDPQTEFTVQSSGAATAFFAQHHPIEFEDTEHYFKDSTGGDIEPVAEHPDPDSDSSGGGGGHSHGGVAVPFEWAGIFDTPEETYHWIAQKVDGDYADCTMKLAAIPVTTAASNAAFFAAETDGKSSMQLDCTAVENGGEITAAENTCYKLVFSPEESESKFIVKPAGAKSIAFFTQHVPTEFEDTKHYLKNVAGEDIEPVKQPDGFEGHDHGDGEAISEEEEFGRKCVCQAETDGWVFDCTNIPNMDESIAYMSSHKNECFSVNPSATCKKWYHVIQAHHDHCLHDVLPKDIEKQLHYFEKLYQDCFVKRQFNPALEVCPPVTCNDKAALQQATDDLKSCDKTAAACAVAKCSNAMKTVLMAHDTCPEDLLPTDLELSLHDHEVSCEAQLCNSASEPFDPKTEPCAAEVSAASGFGSWVPFLVTTLALTLAVSASS